MRRGRSRCRPLLTAVCLGLLSLVYPTGPHSAAAAAIRIRPGSVQYTNVETALRYLERMEGTRSPEMKRLWKWLRSGNIYYSDNVPDPETSPSGAITLPTLAVRQARGTPSRPGYQSLAEQPFEPVANAGQIITLARMLYHENIHVGQSWLTRRRPHGIWGKTSRTLGSGVEYEAWLATLHALRAWTMSTEELLTHQRKAFDFRETAEELLVLYSQLGTFPGDFMGAKWISKREMEDELGVSVEQWRSRYRGLAQQLRAILEIVTRNRDWIATVAREVDRQIAAREYHGEEFRRLGREREREIRTKVGRLYNEALAQRLIRETEVERVVALADASARQGVAVGALLSAPVGTRLVRIGQLLRDARSLGVEGVAADHQAWEGYKKEWEAIRQCIFDTNLVAEIGRGRSGLMWDGTAGEFDSVLGLRQVELMRQRTEELDRASKALADRLEQAIADQRARRAEQARADEQRRQAQRDSVLAQAQQQLATVEGTVHVSGLGLRLGEPAARYSWRGVQNLAADELTAATLRLRTALPFALDVQLTECYQAPCLHGCAWTAAGDTIVCQRASEKRVRAVGHVPAHDGVTVVSASGAVAVDARGQRLVGAAPGSTSVWAQATDAILELQRTPHPGAGTAPYQSLLSGWGWDVTQPCNTHTEPVLGTRRTDQEYRFVVHQAVDLRLTEERRAVRNGQSTQYLEVEPDAVFDLFSVPAYGFRDALVLHATMLVSQGDQDPYETAFAGLHAELDDGGGSFDLHVSGGQISVVPRGPGRARLQLGVADGAGSVGFGRTVTVAASVLEPVQVESRYAAEGGFLQRIPVGEEAVCRVVASGGVDMSAYAVRWHTQEAAHGFSYARTTGFARRGQEWVAENRVGFTRERLVGDVSRAFHARAFDPCAGILDATSVRLSAEVVHGQDQRVVYAFRAQTFTPAMPRVAALHIATVQPSALRVADLNVFTPRSQALIAKLGVVVEFAIGGRATLPLHVAHIDKVGPLPELLQVRRNPYQTWSGELVLGSRLLSSGRYFLPADEVGTGYLHVYLDGESTRVYGLPLAAPVVGDMLTLRFNKLVVELAGRLSAPTGYRFKVLGPADLQRHSVRWRLRDGRTHSGQLTPVAWGHSCETAYEQGNPLDEVQLLNPAGVVVGEYRPSTDGGALPAPEVHVYTLGPEERLPGQRVEEMLPGQRVRVRVAISHLSERNEGEYVCLWEVDPAFGAFDPPVTRPRLSVFGGYSGSTLELSDDLAIAGREVPVRVRLVRQIGGRGL